MMITKISGFVPIRQTNLTQSFGRRRSCIEDTLMIKNYLKELATISRNYESTLKISIVSSNNDSNARRIAEEMIPYIKSRKEMFVKMYSVTEKKDIGEDTNYIRQYILTDKEILRLRTELTKNKYEISKYNISDEKRKSLEGIRYGLVKELEPFEKWEKQLREKIFNS